MNVQSYLNQKITAALHSAGADKKYSALVKPSLRPKFGDYQANGIMAAAKSLKMNPVQLAQDLTKTLDLGDLITKIEVVPPGFINLFISNDWLAKNTNALASSKRANVDPSPKPQTIAVDYSAPNIAKEMHVGHLRSTIIGDAMVRTLEFLGNKVIRCNHVGDWGTQFGMLIAHLENLLQQNSNIFDSELSDLEEFYREAKKQYDTDPEFALTARSYVVKLQGGDPWCYEMWQKLVDMTMKQNQQNYDRLNVSLKESDTMGESLYNDRLPGIVKDLKDKGLAVEDQGAQTVFLDEFTNKQGDPMGVIVQKKDGGFLYTTTDIACAQYRYEKFGAERILYYIDARQGQHLQQAWTIVRKAKLIPESVPLEHHAFGMILGKDGKPFKTRSGETVKLASLIDEAIKRAYELVKNKNPDLDEDKLNVIANIVAIGSIKYADLSKNRTTDYIFDWDQMLAFEGNTAPYLLYAYTRICSIFRKAGKTISAQEVQITTSQERDLAIKLASLPEKIEYVAKEGYPNVLCNFLYELASAFMAFYESCPIHKDNIDKKTQASRLTLCAATANALKVALDLLGIDTIEYM